MTKCSVFIATTLDGFIARKDGSIDWLNRASASAPKDEDFGYAEFIASVDALVMGRNTFEQVLSFGEWAYKSIPVIVVSRHLNSLPANTPSTVSLSRENPREIVKRLSNIGYKHLYIDGGLTIQSFLAEGLITEATITVIPILISTGKPLFGMLPNDVQLELVSSMSYDCGFVQSKYRILTG